MREHAPIYRYEALDMWALTRYDDIREVSRAPERFSSRHGVLINDARFRSKAMSSFFPEGSEVITLTDPPLHRDLRRTVLPAFTPRAVKKLEDSLRQKCRALLEGLPVDEPFDWVERFASRYPLMVMASLLDIDLPIDLLREWSAGTQKMKDRVSEEELRRAAEAMRPIHDFFRDEARSRAGSQATDLISTLTGYVQAGELSEANLVMLCQAFLVGGNDTTRNLLGNAAWAFARHPEQWSALVEEPQLVPNAVEECLRWAGPVPAFMRTATVDTTVRGQPIRADQRVYMIYMAANRDEDVFADPETFDVRRTPDPGHLAFGFGEHHCPGAPLARLEIAIAFEEMAARFSAIELDGAAERHVTVQAYGWDRLDVVLRPRPTGSPNGTVAS